MFDFVHFDVRIGHKLCLNNQTHLEPDLLTTCASPLLPLKNYHQDLLKTHGEKIVLKRCGNAKFMEGKYFNKS